MEQDISILARHFGAVDAVIYSRRNRKKILRSILARSYDLVYVWFVYTYVSNVILACKAARVPCVLVPSGVDLANNPEIGYGLMRFREARIRAKISLRLCNLALPVSEFMMQLVLQQARPKAMQVVYNGIDTELFKPNDQKQDIILSVARIFEGNLLYKRLDIFVQAARFLPEYRFILVGEHVDGTINRLRAMATRNVAFTGYVSEDALIEMYQRARVYVQLSHAEAFGCALAEAMSCECVPVVVRRGALPEVVGDTGYYVPYADPYGTARTIAAALNGDGSSARKRIKQMFTVKKRELQLTKALGSVRSML
jgi:glycosyltransferase involved in cell wall biosynthesis